MDKPIVYINGQPVELDNVGGLSWNPPTHHIVKIDIGCYCSALGRMAPCSWCTDPDNNPDKAVELECECGGEKHGWPHSDWCPKHER